MYLDQFGCIGSFTDEYHIVLISDNHPVIHTPRKYPIYMRDEIKTELDDIMKQGIIRKVSEPTEWVNSLVYICKSNGKLSMCLDPKDLKRAIM